MMKSKIIAIILLIAVSVGTLSSCILLDENMLIPSAGLTGSGDRNTTINVTGGPSYENVNITSTHEKNLLAATKAMLSAVSVVCYVKEYKLVDGEYKEVDTPKSAGSGVIIELDKEKGSAYVITNYHVVSNAKASDQLGVYKDVRLSLYGMENMAEGDVSYQIPATYVGGSLNYDLAVLKVEASTVLMASNAMAAEFADSDEVSILDTAIAIGNPEAGGLSATVGTINVDSENIKVLIDTKNGATAVQLRVMRTDAAVNSGNSGGGLFNDSGKIIGIVNAREADVSVDNMGYAIPSNVAKAIAENAIYYSDGTIKRCMLGITVGVKEYSTDYDLETGKLHKLEKVVITKLEENAAAKGYLSVGDVINSITVDGVTHKVTRIFHVVDNMLWARVGSTVSFNVTDKDGVTKDIVVPITEATLTVY